MLKEKKLQLKNQYDDLYKTDWVEIIGSILVGVLLAVFTVLWFCIVNN